MAQAYHKQLLIVTIAKLWVKDIRILCDARNTIYAHVHITFHICPEYILLLVLITIAPLSDRFWL